MLLPVVGTARSQKFALVLLPISIWSLLQVLNDRRLVAVSEGAGRLETSLGQVEYKSPRFSTGTWMGDTWIPSAGDRLFSVEEMRQLYKGKTMVWIGDSTGRRTSMTLYGILNATTTTSQDGGNSPRSVDRNDINEPKLIDLNKKRVTHPCHIANANICLTMPSDEDNMLINIVKPCTAHAEEFLRMEAAGESNITAGADIVILTLGIWETIKPHMCSRGQNRTVEEVLNGILASMEELQHRGKRPVIIWRTSGYFYNKGIGKPHVIDEMSEHVMDYIDDLSWKYARNGKRSSLAYVNWGGAVQPRSFGADRIAGDIGAHYGLEPRLVMLQMMSNLLSQKYGDRFALQSTS